MILGAGPHQAPAIRRATALGYFVITVDYLPENTGRRFSHRDWAGAAGVRLPVVPEQCEQPHHMFYLLLPSLGQRQSLIAHLKARGIGAVFHYLPLHLSEMGRRLGGEAADCPVTEEVSDRLLRLPFHYGLTEPEQDEVVTAVREFQ